MQTLSIDIETYSDVNLSKCGVYKYAESPDFEILLFGFQIKFFTGVVIPVYTLSLC